MAYALSFGADSVLSIFEYDDPSTFSSFFRNGRGLLATLKMPISSGSKFRREVDFPLPESPRIKTGIVARRRRKGRKALVH